VQYLLDAGANPSIADNSLKTPLYVAATEDDLPGETVHYTIVKMLLKKGADPNKTIRSGETPLMSACLKGINHAGVIELLCLSGSNPSVIHSILGSPLALVCKAIVEGN
jgi:ankyrin repeat protein